MSHMSMSHISHIWVYISRVVDTTHSHASCVALICVTCHSSVWHVTHYLRRPLSTSTHSCVWHDSCIYMTWFVHVWDTTCHACDMLRVWDTTCHACSRVRHHLSCVRHDSFMSTKCRILVLDMTHACLSIHVNESCCSLQNDVFSCYRVAKTHNIPLVAHHFPQKSH